MKLLSMISAKESMRQMSLQDNHHFIRRLSADESIGFFENIFLFFSYEDGYSPLYSSKVVDHPQDPSSSRMCADFWSNTKVLPNQATNIVRMGSYIPNLNKGISTLIGKDAHVDILDNFLLLNFIFRKVYKVINS